MTLTRAWRLLLAASAGLAIALAAGCGGSESPGSESPPESEEAEGRDADPEGDDPQGGEGDAVARRILEACRRIVDGAPGIPDDVKRDLIAECEEAAGDDEEALRSAAGAACDAIAAATAPGPLRGPVASACRRALPSSQRL